MQIIHEVDNFKSSDFWGDAVDTWNKIEDADKVSKAMELLEWDFPDGATMTEVNDLLRFDSDYLFERLGIEVWEE